MIPLRLQLKNFLSYGAEIQTIDFTPHNLICLSGKNGHGKSALLDGITWAIWGKARKVAGASKADEGLLRLGQTQMMVCLDFIFNGKTYRVRREFAVTYGKPYAALDLGIIDESGSIVSLTDKTIKATQDKIETMIGLDYESFVNSAFLRQGQSNEFSQKSPKDRKEILANILGLMRYELLRKKALERVRDLTSHKDMIISLNERIITELQQAPVLHTALAEVKQSLVELEKEEHKLHASLVLINTRKTALIEQNRKADHIRFQLNAKKEEATQAVTKLQTLRNAWRDIHRKRLAMPDYDMLENNKRVISTRINEQQMQLQQSLTIKEQYLKAQEQLHLSAKKIEEHFLKQLQEKQILQERLRSMQEHHTKMMKESNASIERASHESSAINKKTSVLHTQIQARQTLEKDILLFEHQFDKRKAYYQKYIAQGNFITKELEQIVQKQHFSHDDGNPSCPLCEQNLSAARKRFLKTKFTKQEQFLQHRLTRLTQLVRSLKPLLVDSHAALIEQRKKQEEYKQWIMQEQELNSSQSKLELHIGELKKQHAIYAQELNHTTHELEKVSKAIEQAHLSEKTMLSEHEEYQLLKKNVDTLSHTLAQLSYKPDIHNALMQEYTALEQRIHSLTHLRQEITQQSQRAEQIHELILILKSVKNTLRTLETELHTYATLETEHKDLISQEHTLLEMMKQLQQRKEAALQEKGKLENQQQALEKLESELGTQKKKLEEYNSSIDDYMAIGQALGKDGLQALLIEDAIPEIEHEANILLAQLTDNQSHIIIESLRDLKKGGTKETLDIKISDPMGIRPYELFSGGEAFRIDFALRIAISKLLARRAGTSLQTLIIDEGFGSQDEEGLTHIMDALYKIQDNFSKVIIVSHLPSMKDQFPVHFVVEKSSHGSTVRIVEHA